MTSNDATGRGTTAHDDSDAKTQSPPSWRHRLAERTANLCEVFALIAAGAIVLGFFGRWHFIPDLLCHARLQSAWTLIVCGLALGLFRRRRRAAGVLVAGLVALGTLWPWYLPSGETAAATHRLLFVNVLSRNPHHDRVIACIRSADPDFVLLQETTPAWIESLDAAIADDWPHRMVDARKGNFGIALYSRVPWSDCQMFEYSRNFVAPVIDARFDLDHGTAVRLISLHALPPMNGRQWSTRNMMLGKLADDVRRHDPPHTIVAGDLNCSPWSHWFKRLLRDAQLRNATRGHGVSTTWRPVSVGLLGVPVDHVLVGNRVRVVGHRVGPDVGSDHRPVIVDFAVQRPSPGSGG